MDSFGATSGKCDLDQILLVTSIRCKFQAMCRFTASIVIRIGFVGEKEDFSTPIINFNIHGIPFHHLGHFEFLYRKEAGDKIANILSDQETKNEAGPLKPSAVLLDSPTTA